MATDKPREKILLCLVAAVAWGLPFQVEAAAPLVFIGLVPFLFLVASGRYKKVLLASYAIGAMTTTFGIAWLWEVWAPLPFVAGAYFGLYALLFGWASSRLCRRTGLPLVVVIPPLFVGMEFLKTYVSLFRTTWLHLAYPLADWTDLTQISRWTGHFGVTFVVILVNAALAEGILSWRAGRGLRRGRVIGSAAAAAGLLLAVLLWGFWGPRAPGEGEGPTVGVVQANLPLSMTVDYTRWEEVLRRHVELTRGRGGAGIDLWIWPEASYPGRIETRKEAVEAVRALTADLSTPLLFGCLGSKTLRGEQRPTNTGFLLLPEGTITARFDKRVLVPFGETIPILGRIRSLRRPIADFLFRTAGFRPHIAPGDHVKPARIRWSGGVARVGALICYEVVLPDLARSSRRSGAEILVNLSNEAWFPRKEQEQILAMARFRAVENGVPLVRATTTGITCIISPRGEVVEALPGVAGVMVRKVPLPEGDSTFYSRRGDLFCWLLFLAAAGTFIPAWVRRSRHGRGGTVCDQS